jgi:hypothetical protein
VTVVQSLPVAKLQWVGLALGWVTTDSDGAVGISNEAICREGITGNVNCDWQNSFKLSYTTPHHFTIIIIIIIIP